MKKTLTITTTAIMIGWAGLAYSKVPVSSVILDVPVFTGKPDTNRADSVLKEMFKVFPLSNSCLSDIDNALYNTALSKPSISQDCLLVDGSGEWEVLSKEGVVDRGYSSALIPVYIISSKGIKNRIKLQEDEGDKTDYSGFNWVVVSADKYDQLIQTFPFNLKSDEVGSCKATEALAKMALTRELAITLDERDMIAFSEAKMGCEKYLTFGQDDIDNYDVNKYKNDKVGVFDVKSDYWKWKG